MGLGVKLAEDDVYTTLFGREAVVHDECSAKRYSKPSSGDDKRFITSFAERENKGVQPAPDGFPVVVTFKGGRIPGCKSSLAKDVDWESGHWYARWKPDYEKLLEMQKEHDLNKEFCKAADMSFNQEKPIEELMINAKESKMSNVYTQEMKDSGVPPAIGVEVNLLNEEGFEIEYGKRLIGQTVKVLSEPLPASGSVSVQAIEFDGNCYCFRSSMLHPAKSKEELELEEAKDKQVKEVSQFLRELAKSTGFDEAAKALQEKGILAEIVLPLEGK